MMLEKPALAITSGEPVGIGPELCAMLAVRHAETPFAARLVVLVLIWAYLHHFIAGLRHLYMDVSHKTSKEFGRQSATITLVLSLSLTVILGAKLFGMY